MEERSGSIFKCPQLSLCQEPRVGKQREIWALLNMLPILLFPAGIAGLAGNYKSPLPGSAGTEKRREGS